MNTKTGAKHTTSEIVPLSKTNSKLQNLLNLAEPSQGLTLFIYWSFLTSPDLINASNTCQSTEENSSDLYCLG